MPALSTAHPRAAEIRRVARVVLLAGMGIMLLKFGVFLLTDSAAVLTDALESIINIVAAAILVYSTWLANVPADENHPYGHGKVEFITLGAEGGMICAAGLTIALVAGDRLLHPVALRRLDAGMWMLAAVNLLNGLLAVYVLACGRRYDSPSLKADGKHLLTDVGSTLGVLLGLALVRWTGWLWMDPLVALVMAGLILLTSLRLLAQSAHGLMDRRDPADHAAICAILDQEVQAGHIRGYHKVRHRHVGHFHWVDMHLQVSPGMTVRDSHALASRIEYRIEQALRPAKATAHVEPDEAGDPHEPRA